MKVICTQENLRSGLAIVGRIISPSNSLPILNNILIKTENGQLTISSTNLELAITTHIRCKIEEEGEITVFSKTIIDLINNLPNKNIVLENKNGILEIETENYHTSIKTLPAEEFPLIPGIEAKYAISCGGQELKKSLDQVMFASSTNHTQPEISGVLISVSADILTVAATDRYRLAEKKVIIPKQQNSAQVIIPHKTAQELSRVIGTSTQEVELSFSDTQVSASLDQTQIISRLIDGQYPDYKQIVPEKFTAVITTPKQPLVNALRAGGIFSQSSNSVHMQYGADSQNLTITSESQDLGKSVVDLPSQIEGESGSVLLNHRYILDCLGNIDSENVIIKITNSSAATLIVPEGQKDYIYLVMPIKS